MVKIPKRIATWSLFGRSISRRKRKLIISNSEAVLGNMGSVTRVRTEMRDRTKEINAIKDLVRGGGEEDAFLCMKKIGEIRRSWKGHLDALSNVEAKASKNIDFLQKLEDKGLKHQEIVRKLNKSVPDKLSMIRINEGIGKEKEALQKSIYELDKINAVIIGAAPKTELHKP